MFPFIRLVQFSASIQVNVKAQPSASGPMMPSRYIIGVLLLIAAVGVVLRSYPSKFGINNRLPFSFCFQNAMGMIEARLRPVLAPSVWAGVCYSL